MPDLLKPGQSVALWGEICLSWILGPDRKATHAFQFADGSIARRWASEAPGIAVLNGGRETGLLPLNSDQARELAAALLAAADELDGLEGTGSS